MLRAIVVLLLASGRGKLAAATHGCPSGAPVATFQLSVTRGPESVRGRTTLPVERVNQLQPWERLVYQPVHLPAAFKKTAKIALILAPAVAPAGNAEKSAPGEAPRLKVLEPQPADEPAEWDVPFRTAVVALVFGPQGINERKMASLVNKDKELISQLADYAEQTTEVGSLIDKLSSPEQGAEAAKSLSAALSGVAGQSGSAPSKLDMGAPTEKQVGALLRTLNPTLGSYDPLAGQSSARMQQSAGLAASVAGMFFGSPVGLALGSAALVENLRGMLFPDTDFRSALAQTAGASEAHPQALTLCGKRDSAKARTRIAYLWALRIPNAAPPQITLEKPAGLPIGAKSGLAVKVSDAKQWALLDRARDWALTTANGMRTIPVAVKPAAKSQSLEIDLSKFPAPAGAYRLSAKWDWDAFQVMGALQLFAISSLKGAHVTPESQDRLITGSGPVEIQLAGDDFQFVKNVAVRPAGDRSAKPEELHFRAPGGQPGPQESFEVTVDTQALKAGRYQLLLTQPDGTVREVPMRILPPNPRLDGLPLRANLGESRQKIDLRGAGLERIEGITADEADIQLEPAGRTSRESNREAMIRLRPQAKKGDLIALKLRVEGLHAPAPVEAAIRVEGPRPRIANVEASWPEDLSVALHKGELPAGSFVSFSMRVENLEAQPAARIACTDSAKTLQAQTLRPGENRDAARLEMAGQNALFLSLDPGAIGQAGCTLTGVVESEPAGASDPYTLGRVVRLPRIESFTLTDEKLGPSTYAGILKGQSLETIDKTGWDARTGLPVAGLPKPVLGEGQEQTLKIAVPWPSPAPRAPLYVWLRGEAEGRLTRARY